MLPDLHFAHNILSQMAWPDQSKIASSGPDSAVLLEAGAQ